ncbi:stage II sporulation protein E [Paenibacillus eucommiae]|uniref:Stage II sporulation protein E n=1 Tax=Paenibacillus eucommiae TaxID=1355755 RepID=A0ABS4J8I8_9BACL|nr:stage II sporulation protein E [Paenibacillus eucommiae]MBP1996162.1 stage II sporulation protein E [Paenibacillus eucommiae]
MEKRSIVAMFGGSWLHVWQKTSASAWGKTSENKVVQAFLVRKWALLLVIMGFLLGRAMILEQLSPFALAYFAVVYALRKDLIPWVGVAIFAGSLLAVTPNTGYIVAEILVFLLIHKALGRYGRTELSMAPWIVFGVTFLVQLFAVLVKANLNWYSIMMISVESFLSLILTLIFIQAIPVFTLTRKNYHLKNEEIICLIILLGSVMTGTVGWLIGPVTMEHVLSRYMILLFALVGGAPLGASVGVITGLILSLANSNAIYQMSLLAFSGMLAGLLKEGNRLAVALGMLLGSSILSIYMGSQTDIMNSTWESLAAVALFLLTPRSFIETLAKYVPGTQENLKSQQDYAKRVRDITASRVQQFSEVFQQLSQSFKQLTSETQGNRKEEEAQHFVNAVANKTCDGCWKKTQCWDTRLYQTYTYMTDMMGAIEQKENMAKKDIPQEWKKVCVRTDLVLEVMKQQYGLHKNDRHWKRQIMDSRQLVAEQLSGVSQVMEDLATEIKREGQEMFIQEEQIRSTLEELGLSIHSIDIISLDEGNIEIEIIHQYTRGFDECRKVIAPLLSEILGENVAVKNEKMLAKGDGYSTVSFGSAKEYDIETGVAAVAKGGDLLSGDSYSMVELGNGKFAVALSDGMGNGGRAREESSSALAILQQLLQSGMDEKLAVKSLNSVLMLRSPDEMYATVDMALIDLYSADTTFMKIGSSPSFIKRGNEVFSVMANNLPVGILQEIDVDLVSASLESGDMLIMMTDGIYDAPGHAVNKEMWMKRIIQEIEVTQPQDFAECLLERIFRNMHGHIGDDMTVVVARVDKRQPEWATFHWPGISRIERPKTVS